MAARPATLFVAVVPVIVGAALAWREAAALDWRVVLVALAAAVFIQIGTNLFNDVGDFERGADGADRLGPPRPTSLGWLSPADVRRAAATSFGLAMVLGAWLVSVGGWPIFVIGIASVVAGVAYTGGPKPIAYSATGEIFVFLFFGLVATGGSYYLQTGGVTWPVITAGAMLGALAAAVLVVNNYRDIESDRRAGKITLAVRIGRPASRVEFALLVAVPFAMLPLFGRAVGLGWPLFLPLATAPFAAWLIRDLARAPVGVALNGVLKRTAVLEFLFGMLLAAALAV
ncbi:MAG: 1,4-dihydroxy-2-naphthoate polyprenyltransferase [Burkholderiales bacterium]|jgi:1,4-dihydroxy-2-naphthoate octaprenyltransferase|nr:1,4-dihydroxy-2-naphthoate polyprenyltransferase [Burkholderiales bacterium]